MNRNACRVPKVACMEAARNGQLEAIELFHPVHIGHSVGGGEVRSRGR